MLAGSRAETELRVHYDFEASSGSVVPNLSNAAAPGRLETRDPEAFASDPDPGRGRVLRCAPGVSAAEATRVIAGSAGSLGLLSAYSVAAWVKPEGVSWFEAETATVSEWAEESQQVLTVIGQDSFEPLSFNLTLGVNRRGSMTMRHGGWDSGISSGRLVIEPEGWQHLVWTYDGEGGRFYRNGKEVSLESPTLGNGVTPLTHDAPVVVGANVQQFPFSGFIDDLRLYDGVLTPESVRALFARPAENGGSPRAEVQLSLLWMTIDWEGLHRETKYHLEHSPDLDEWKTLGSSRLSDANGRLRIRELRPQDGRHQRFGYFRLRQGNP
ncbi:MAG: LamG domain-containing protein [Verrucomicrobiota bacterium]